MTCLNAIVLCGILVACTLIPTAAHAAYPQPHVKNVGLVASNILGLAVSDGHNVRRGQVPYISQPGDSISTDGGTRYLTRGGSEVGILVAGDSMLKVFDEVHNKLADPDRFDNDSQFVISSPDDPAYTDPRAPVVVHRKSHNSRVAQTGKSQRQVLVTHFLYLELPALLQTGCTYTLSFPSGTITNHTFAFQPESMRSEAVHVSQAGFAPESPRKIAFFSCWLGDGGRLSHPPGMTFAVLDDSTGARVFEGALQVSCLANEVEDPDGHHRNYTKTDVYLMDFSGLDATGRFRVYVDGIGCSFPFEISERTWSDTFALMMEGLLIQRSGCALGPPHTEFVRPRCFHPDDGVTVYHSTCPLLESGNGLNAHGTDNGNFANLRAGKTATVVPDAWGGYMDAGDWDRRIQHLFVSQLLMELFELFPEHYRLMAVPMPEMDNHIPDLLDEVMFNVDCYRRMQTADGGIRGGIESWEHPRKGECSWQESLVIMAYAPDLWSSYCYAAAAGRLAHIMRGIDDDLAATYSNSALRAMLYAERAHATSNFSRMKQSAQDSIRDARNHAACEMFRMTGDIDWHVLYSETSVLTHDSMRPQDNGYDQDLAAFSYLLSTQPMASGTIKSRYRKIFKRYADEIAARGDHTAFRWSRHHPYLPISYGRLSTPPAYHLFRAHWLTGNSTYLAAGIESLQYATGANPLNAAFTTGLGTNAVEYPLHIDSRNSGQPVPGITVYGPFDMDQYAGTGTSADDWCMYWYVRFHSHPLYTQWPTTEAYFDTDIHPAQCEFTVQQTMGENAINWGYLAAVSAPVPEPCGGLAAVVLAALLRRRTK